MEAFLVCVGIFILFTQEPESQVQKVSRSLQNPLGLAQSPLQAQAELNQKSGSLVVTQMDGERRGLNPAFRSPTWAFAWPGLLAGQPRAPLSPR